VITWRRVRCGSGACLEVAHDHRREDVLLRSSLRPQKVLRVTADEWDALIRAIGRGEIE